MDRRAFFHQTGHVGGLALAWMLHHEARADDPKPQLHFPAKAKRVIQIFCPGGVSQVDTFDYKPELAKRNGQPLGEKIDTFFAAPGNLFQSPFKFAQHGQCGQWVSEIFPHLAKRVDDLTFIHSMVAKSSNHTPAAFQMNTGFVLNGFPSLGSWLSYGLGSMNQDLPTFVVLPDPRGLPAGGSINWGNGFLPATHQGVAFRTTGDEPIHALTTPKDVSPQAREASMTLLQQMNTQFRDEVPGDSSLTARIRAYELAARMQTSIPETVKFSDEPERIQKLYGLDQKPTVAGFGRNCLLARRLVERGVRFVQIWHGGAFGSPRINWDGHEDVALNHREQAGILDQPLAALLTDLKQRDMLKDTLVLWTTEFGRTPITQGIGAKGRDHHPQVFTVWMAGAGLKPGFAYGKSDDVGYKPAEFPTSIYDFHATLLHLLGLDHTKLTYYHNGSKRRLTDVHGEVIEDILG